jgi:hypothetical protein
MAKALRTTGRVRAGHSQSDAHDPALPRGNPILSR